MALYKPIKLIGIDRRGGKGYREVSCEGCGNPLFIGVDSESGICARCVVMGYSGPKIEVNIQELNKAIQGNFLKRYRKKNKLTQDIIAQYLGISRMHYWRIEEGKPVGKNIIRKIEGKLAQVEKGQ